MIFNFILEGKIMDGNKFNELKRQMGNARFFISRSCSTLENHRLACKVMGVKSGWGFEEKKFTRIEVNSDGNGKYWYLGNKLHRMDGPAIEYLDGYKEWWVEGKRHRINGPAVEALEYKEWCVEGKLHRVDGPAIEEADGSKAWYFEGKRHRVDGPAVEWFNGFGEYCCQWWVDGVKQDR